MSALAKQPASCVVLHPDGHRPPNELLSALRRRGIDASTADDVFGAMAECCLRRSEGVLVLLLAEPDRLRETVGEQRLAEFLDTFGKYVPSSAVWVYQSDATPELRGFVDEDARRLTRARDTQGGSHDASSDPGGDARSMGWGPAPAVPPTSASAGGDRRSGQGAGQAPALRLVDDRPEKPGRGAARGGDGGDSAGIAARTDNPAQAGSMGEPGRKPEHGTARNEQNPKDAGPRDDSRGTLSDEELAALLGDR